jgi:hypothetical protein
MANTFPETDLLLGPCCQRIAGHIFLADRALSILRAIGEASPRLNAEHFGDVFHSIQGALSDQVILSLAKLFEPPHRTYPILSLPTLVIAIEVNTTSLQIQDRTRTIGFLLAANPDGKWSHSTPDQDLTTALVAIMRDQQPNVHKKILAAHDKVLEALRAQRDKSIAHSEALDRALLPAATWAQLESLLATAKSHLGAVGWAYTNTAYTMDDGSYSLTSDAERGGIALRRVFRRAALLAAEGPMDAA